MSNNNGLGAEAPLVLAPIFPVWWTSITLQSKGTDSSLVTVSTSLAMSLLLFSSMPVE